MLEKCKKGVFIVNTARGKIVDADAMADACESGHVAGYAGDVWFPQPAPRNHPWRLMSNHALTPHVSGTTLDAQARYAGNKYHFFFGNVVFCVFCSLLFVVLFCLCNSNKTN